MATLILTSLVSSAGLTGFTAFAASLAATAVGSFIDNALFGQNFNQEGPRLNEMNVTSSSEGTPIRRLFGRSRLGGNIIWASNLKETKKTEKQGGKGGGPTVTTTTYSYSVSFAVAFCEGNSRTSLGRVWADGQLIDTEDLDIAFYPGSDDQPVDPTIEGVEGTGNVPAFRGVAYLVFKDLVLDDFGNRIPSITAELVKPLAEPEEGSMEEVIGAVNLIPSTGEAAYGTTPTVRDDGFGNSVPENLNLSRTRTNLEAAMDDLGRQLPSVQSVNLVISWFGTDLRAGSCEFRPKVEAKTGRELLPDGWRVGGLTRSSAQVQEVSTFDGDPAFGGTPADWSVVEAISRIAEVDGMSVAFYPFLLMDIPAGNTLPDVDGVSTGQPVYPWRGRITTSTPAVDGTPDAQAEVDAMMGSVSASDFSVSGTTVTYTGSASDFGYRRFVLHYAHLCAAAAASLSDPSKFKSFYIGTEMRGLTRIRSTAPGTATASTVYPGVNALVQLLEDVRAVFDAAGLTSVQLSYAADWSEFHSHRPDDGSGDVYFNMDAIWGHPACSYVAIDNYTKLSDFRDGDAHEDYGTGTVTAYATTGPFASSGFPQGTSIYDKEYLAGQVEGGEDYDYFYASDADRENQVRTTIVDGAHDEHWVFRQKDFRNWWGQPHRSRPGGVRDASVMALSDGASGATDTWTPSSKRIVFSEYGVPAVDRGTNQPNVFFDPKSSESFLPHFSRGNRDDFIQRVYYETYVKYWTENSPTSPILMTDMSEAAAWTWDARPFPAFPFRSDIWSDSVNYERGHWLNGRAGVFTLGQLVREICRLGGLDDADVDVTGLSNSTSIVRGYVVDGLSSPRDMIAPLANAYLFDGFESEGRVKFLLRANTVFTEVNLDELVIVGEAAGGYAITRMQETELPAASTVSFIDEEKDYQIGSAGGVRMVGESRNVIDRRFPIVLDERFARALSEVLIQQEWTGRERGEWILPPNRLALDPGDGIRVQVKGRTLEHLVAAVERGAELTVRTASHDTSVYDTITFDSIGASTGAIAVFGRSVLYFLELPLLTGDEPRPWAPRVAAYQSPFPAFVSLLRDNGATLDPDTQLDVPIVLGQTTAPLPGADPWRFDNTNVLSVKLFDPNATLLSAGSKLDVLNGANAVAVETPSGSWEVLQFVEAALTGADQGLPLYDLSVLLRGQLGTETEVQPVLAAGARFVVLQREAVFATAVTRSQQLSTLDYRYGPAGTDPAGGLYQDVSHQGQATGLRPYAPVRLKKTPVPGSDDVTFSWVRRTRFGGDDFDQELTPLNEEAELYDLEIYDPVGPTLRRTVSDLATPAYTYTTAQQTSDGGVLGLYLIRVWQKSTAVGRGRRAERTL